MDVQRLAYYSDGNDEICLPGFVSVCVLRAATYEGFPGCLMQWENMTRVIVDMIQSIRLTARWLWVTSLYISFKLGSTALPVKHGIEVCTWSWMTVSPLGLSKCILWVASYRIHVLHMYVRGRLCIFFLGVTL